MNTFNTSMITLDGYLERINFQNEASHYTIAKLKTSEDSNPVTVVGVMPGIMPGQTLKIKGSWETHQKFGEQFKAESYEVLLPSTADGIKKYLQSGVIKGIGKKMADRMVSQFGSLTLEIIENQPERLMEIPGIGEAKASTIRNAWGKHHAIRELMAFLQEQGVNASYSAVILKEYGEDALTILKTDPFRLADDIPGKGFIIADAITRKQGIENDDPKRIRACILYIMRESVNAGHVYSLNDQILSRCRDMFDINYEAADNVLESMSECNEIVIEAVLDAPERKAVYSYLLYEAETGIALRLITLLSIPLDYPAIDKEHISKEVLKKLAIRLSPAQIEVLEDILLHRVSIITGGPGTGKTTLIRSIKTVFDALGKTILLAAPTGRASRRLSELTRKKAVTIHKLLEYNAMDDIFEKNHDNPLDADVVIIDEASMVDTFLMFHLLKAISVTSVVIFVGDVFQLPAVGPGNVLSDMIASHKIQTFELKDIFRQSEESPIVINAHKVLQGEMPELVQENTDTLGEFYFIEQVNPSAVSRTVVELCKERIPSRFNLDPMSDIQVITPMHKGEVGTINLNKMLQKALNTSPDSITGMGITYRTGDKVMHLKNNYQKDVFNGDIGIITAIDREKEKISIDYYGRSVNYDIDEMQEVSLAYAISVHKSQGSEYPAVVMPLLTQHYALLQRNLLYTAITRGVKLVILIGTQKALAIALHNDKPRKRFSNLVNRLVNY